MTMCSSPETSDAATAAGWNALLTHDLQVLTLCSLSFFYVDVDAYLLPMGGQ
jgi:hypothetical protein